MKKRKRTIIITTIILISTILTLEGYAQERSELRYRINYKFTGKVKNKVDSVYSIKCVVDRKALEKISRLYVKMGKKQGSAELYKLALDSVVVFSKSAIEIEGVKRDENTVTIDMGEHTTGACYIEVWTREGEYDKEDKLRGVHKKAVRDDRLEISVDK